MATFNYFTFLSFSLLNLLEGGASLSAGPQVALGSTGTPLLPCKGEEPLSTLGSRCRLTAWTKVTAGSAAQHLSGKLSPRCHNFSNTALVLPQTLGHSQQGSIAFQQLNVISN